MWNVQTGKVLSTIKRMAVGTFVISYDGSTLFCGNDNKQIIIWDLEKAKIKHILTGHESAISSITINHDEQLLVTGSNDGSIKIWSKRKT